MDFAAIKQWIAGHKLAAGGIGAGALAGGLLLLRKGKPAGAATGQPARLVVGSGTPGTARVAIALNELEQHHARQPHRHHREQHRWHPPQGGPPRVPGRRRR